MKKAIIILMAVVIITACHHSSSPTPSPAPTPVTTPPPTTTTTAMAAETNSLVGVWILDSTVSYNSGTHVFTQLPSASGGTDYTITITSSEYSTVVPSYSAMPNDLLYSWKTSLTASTNGIWSWNQSIYSSTGDFYINLVPIGGYIVSVTSTSLVTVTSSGAPTSVKNGLFHYLHK